MKRDPASNGKRNPTLSRSGCDKKYKQGGWAKWGLEKLPIIKLRGYGTRGKLPYYFFQLRSTNDHY